MIPLQYRRNAKKQLVGLTSRWIMMNSDESWWIFLFSFRLPLFWSLDQPPWRSRSWTAAAAIATISVIPATGLTARWTGWTGWTGLTGTAILAKEVPQNCLLLGFLHNFLILIILILLGGSPRSGRSLHGILRHLGLSFFVWNEISEAMAIWQWHRIASCGSGPHLSLTVINCLSGSSGYCCLQTAFLYILWKMCMNRKTTKKNEKQLIHTASLPLLAWVEPVRFVSISGPLEGFQALF